MRGTDWWAVAVEVAIVVLGILIAFQLDAWGDRRAQQRAERQLWQRLAEETRTDIAALDNVIGEHLESAANYRLLAEAVSNERAHAGIIAAARSAATCFGFRRCSGSRQAPSARPPALGST